MSKQVDLHSYRTDTGYIAGDSVKGTSYGKYQGGVILPMLKLVIQMGQWGESDLDVFTLGIAAQGQQMVAALSEGINNLLL